MTETPTLRVAHFTFGRCNPDNANGVDKSVYHLARSQARLGHEVAVFSLTEKPPLPIPGVSVATYAPVPRAMSWMLRAMRVPAYWSVPDRLPVDIAGWRPDVLHLHSVHIPANVVLARRLSPSIPYCVTTHGGLSEIRQQRTRWKKRVFKILFERDYLRMAAFLHAISEEDAEGIESYGVTNTIVFAPNGIEVDSDSSGRESAAPPLRLLLPEVFGRRVFLYLGRLDVLQKGLDLLLQGFARARLRDVVIVLVGPHWRESRDTLEALVRSLGITGDVIFAGPAYGSAKIDLLRLADVFVHPSRSEAGVPFSVLEAAALERPCLLTTAADPSRTLATSRGAHVVEPTIDAIAAGLTEMSSMSADALRAMGQRARQVVAKEFSWERTAQTIIDAYRTHAVRNPRHTHCAEATLPERAR